MNEWMKCMDDWMEESLHGWLNERWKTQNQWTNSIISLTVYKHEIAARERDPNDDGEIEIKTIDNREISTQIKGFSTCTDYMFYSVDGFRVSHNIQTGRMVPQVGQPNIYLRLAGAENIAEKIYQRIDRRINPRVLYTVRVHTSDKQTPWRFTDQPVAFNDRRLEMKHSAIINIRQFRQTVFKPIHVCQCTFHPLSRTCWRVPCVSSRDIESRFWARWRTSDWSPTLPTVPTISRSPPSSCSIHGPSHDDELLWKAVDREKFIQSE